MPFLFYSFFFSLTNSLFHIFFIYTRELGQLGPVAAPLRTCVRTDIFFFCLGDSLFFFFFPYHHFVRYCVDAILLFSVYLCALPYNCRSILQSCEPFFVCFSLSLPFAFPFAVLFFVYFFFFLHYKVLISTNVFNLFLCMCFADLTLAFFNFFFFIFPTCVSFH